MIQEVIYKDRDNRIGLRLSTDAGVANLSDVSKIELVDKSGRIDTISSINNPDFFDTSAGDGVLTLALGLADLIIGKSHVLNLIIYNGGNPNGINWGQFFVAVR